MKRIFYFLGLLGMILMSACADANGIEPTDTAQPSPTVVETLSLEKTADQVIRALADKDLETVASFVHPQQGLRFSPYAFIREEHQVFMAEELTGLLALELVTTWGRYDGSGEPIDLTFEEYYEEFVYSSDFANADQVAVNERLGQGNTINNVEEFYPEASFVEYYILGTEKFGGMDWESLRLVFIQEDDIWLLVGIVHDEWTI